MSAERHILHVDMDAFYASVEQRDNPELRGKPLVVGGGSNRGVVAAASYEAREFGIRSAMPMREANQRCPDLLRVAPRMAHYQSVSSEVFSVFRQFTPQVEGLSLDEAFLDVTASLALFGSAVEIGRQIKARIRSDTRLTASVGIAPNKLVAKIASDLDKPDGLVIVTLENLRELLDPLPVSVIPGIGKRTLSQLHAASIRTIANLRIAPDRDLEPIFGRFTARTRERACGIDARPVIPSRPDKSISAEETFDTDLYKPADLQRKLMRLSERTASRLRKKGLTAATLQVKIRDSEFATFTRQQTLQPAGNGTGQLYESASHLLRGWLSENPGARIRLLGVAGSGLAEDSQQQLFADGDIAANAQLDQAVDDIRERFGGPSMARARTLDRH